MKKNSIFNSLWLIFLFVSILHIIYATYTYQGMFKDGASFIVDTLDMLSNNLCFFSTDSHHPRFLIQSLLQLPFVIVYFITHITNKFLYMGIYSFTLFFTPLLVLICNYKLTKRTKNIYCFYFNLFIYALFIMPFSFFAIVESILGINFCFLLWNYLSSDIIYNKKDILVIFFLSIMMISQYEYISYIGIIFFAASIFYALKSKNIKEKLIKIFIGVISLISSIYTIIFIFLHKGTIDELLMFFSNIVEVIDCIKSPFGIFSLLALILLVISYFKKINFLIILFINIFLFVNSLFVNVINVYNYSFRNLVYIVLPFLFLILLFRDICSINKIGDNLKNYLHIILISLIFSTLWQIVCTYYWQCNISFMKEQLNTSKEKLFSMEGQMIKPVVYKTNIILSLCATTSLLFSDSYEQKSLLIDNCENLNIMSDKLVIIPYTSIVRIKNKFWDMTDCVKALYIYNQKLDLLQKDKELQKHYEKTIKNKMRCFFR